MAVAGRIVRCVGPMGAFLLWCAIPHAEAQWLTQRFSLQPGWNAIHLSVHPEPVYCNDIFDGVPVESVWKWDRQYTTVQFADDPYEPIPENPHWLAWLPPDHPEAFLGRLYALQGGQSYLVRVASNAAPFTLPIKGRVIVPDPQWYPQSLNLMGFPVHTNNPATFSDSAQPEPALVVPFSTMIVAGKN